jgi:2-oxoglutarate dehydrogenase E2 component (dihydrolipoamide succinyltransferase)
VIATIEAGGAAAAPAPAAAAAPAPAAAAPVTPVAPAEPAAAESSDPAVLSPAVRRAVLEYGIDPATIKVRAGRPHHQGRRGCRRSGQGRLACRRRRFGPVAAPSNERREERVKMTACARPSPSV